MPVAPVPGRHHRLHHCFGTRCATGGLDGYARLVVVPRAGARTGLRPAHRQERRVDQVGTGWKVHNRASVEHRSRRACRSTHLGGGTAVLTPRHREIRHPAARPASLISGHEAVGEGFRVATTRRGRCPSDGNRTRHPGVVSPPPEALLFGSAERHRERPRAVNGRRPQAHARAARRGCALILKRSFQQRGQLSTINCSAVAGSGIEGSSRSLAGTYGPACGIEPGALWIPDGSQVDRPTGRRRTS